MPIPLREGIVLKLNPTSEDSCPNPQQRHSFLSCIGRVSMRSIWLGRNYVPRGVQPGGIVGYDSTLAETHFPLYFFSYLFFVSDFAGGLGS